jgi:hypothetical protein
VQVRVSCPPELVSAVVFPSYTADPGEHVYGVERACPRAEAQESCDQRERCVVTVAHSVNPAPLHPSAWACALNRWSPEATERIDKLKLALPVLRADVEQKVHDLAALKQDCQAQKCVRSRLVVPRPTASTCIPHMYCVAVNARLFRPQRCTAKHDCSAGAGSAAQRPQAHGRRSTAGGDVGKGRSSLRPPLPPALHVRGKDPFGVSQPPWVPHAHTLALLPSFVHVAPSLSCRWLR